METTITAFTGAILLATFIESFVEYLFGKLAIAQEVLHYIALFVGVVLAVLLHIDIIAVFFPGQNALITTVMTGMIIGRGSNFVHDFMANRA